MHDRAVTVTATRLSVGHTTLSVPVSKCSIFVKSIVQCFVSELEVSVAKTVFIFRASQFSTPKHWIRSTWRNVIIPTDTMKLNPIISGSISFRVRCYFKTNCVFLEIYEHFAIII